MRRIQNNTRTFVLVDLLRFERSLHTSRTCNQPRRPPTPASPPPKFGNYDLILPSSASSSKASPRRYERPHIPAHIQKPSYWSSGALEITPNPSIKTNDDIHSMQKACRLAAGILEYSESLVKPGITTEEIDARVHDAIIASDAYPSPLNYLGYPKSICTSVNNVVAHGIPDSRPLRDGDIVNIDVTVYIDAFHGDTSATFLVGDVDEHGRNLVHTTRRALDLGISVCRPGVPFAAIGAAIQDFAKQHSYTVNRDFCGHGIGHHFHESPLIYHFWNSEPGVMQEGMTFTIEPMLNQGSSRMVKWRDGWTAVTVDGGRSAQFEHTILITGDGARILTCTSEPEPLKINKPSHFLTEAALLSSPLA
ncbi:hypothetical protein SeMB42_g07608 [Synchytrium endobioticum]|uniref:Methionine aminopeptidase n=1 Tax=Synchytrium endobioticum TaxID=286115 RepID=A0A507CI29_9FUNG|nr:hypothetical protein SeMB42_g07608 [Synchytrium endobioticum]TPX39282.1 hypothetical protein SeLEV6574_g07329 [Synchytrium endobioticum]